MAYEPTLRMVAARTPSFYIWLRWILFVLIMGGLGAAYVHLAEECIHAAAERSLTDEEIRHLTLTRATQKDLRPEFTQSFSEPLKKLAPHRTDGLVQPLWPWVAAWMITDEGSPSSLRSTAWFRVGLTLACLVLLGLVCLRYFALPGALLAVTLAAFHGWLGTLCEFSGATLFHLFFLLTWLACVYGLQRNSLWVYGVVGVFGALAYLSEDRILPMLIVFIVISTLRALWGWLAAHWCTGEGTTLWLRDNHLFGLLLLTAGFLFIGGPRLAEADLLFGDPTFHFVDQVRWLDQPDAAATWIANHPDKTSLEQVPPLERLSARNYFQTHTAKEAKTRLIQGLDSVIVQWQGRGGEVLAVLLILLVVLTMACWCSTPKACHAGERLHPETATTVLFLVMVTTTYLVIAGWDAAVMGIRHLHALTAPLGLSLLWGYESVLRRARRRGAGWMLARGYQTVLWLLLTMSLLQIWKSGTPIPSSTALTPPPAG